MILILLLVLLVVSLISCSSTSVITADDYPRIDGVVQVQDDEIVLALTDVTPIIMQIDAGKKLLQYLTDLRDWGLYHYEY